MLPIHVEQMRNAPADAGHALEWVPYPNEGHGGFKTENRIDFAERMEAFLALRLK